jgi:hypothetical protein
MIGEAKIDRRTLLAGGDVTLNYERVGSPNLPANRTHRRSS